jgi:hypothetical protein
MKAIINHTIGMLIASSVFAFATGAAVAQDPTQVDAKHYKVTFENDQVRILRITYGPHEKSVMHEHPISIAVFLADVGSNSLCQTASRKNAMLRPGNPYGTSQASTCPKT